MSTSVASLSTNFFPSAENGFTTTTSGSVSSGAVTVGLNSVAGYSNGEVVVFVIDPTDAAKKQTFTGVMDTSGSQVTSVVWTAGTNQIHALGATVVDYATATHISMITKGIRQHANQDGTLISQAVRDALNLDSGSSDGWTPFGYSLTSITALGNRSYTAVVSGVDTTGVTCVGQRLKLPRTVTAPTGSITLNGSSQYANRLSAAPINGMTFTNNYVVSGWVKLTSYSTGDVVSRYNGTSGFEFRSGPSGQMEILSYNGGSSNFLQMYTYQSIPLNKWVHVAAQVDMTVTTNTPTTNYIMIDGKDVPVAIARGGTNPTALIQAGNLEIGSRNGGLTPWTGQIAQVAIYSAKVTQATILASMNQTLTGSETSLVSAYKLDQASGLNDLSANANNLTAQGSPSYSTTQTPFTNVVTGTSVTAGTTNYGIIMAQTFSTNTTYTIQIPEGETLPTTGGIGTVSYSTQKTPYGFPGQRGKWDIETRNKADSASPANSTYNHNITLTVPVGEWDLGYEIHAYFANGVTNPVANIGLSTSSSSFTNKELTSKFESSAPNNLSIGTMLSRTSPVSITTATPYYMVSASGNANTSQIVRDFSGTTESFVRARNAYL